MIRSCADISASLARSSLLAASLLFCLLPVHAQTIPEEEPQALESDPERLQALLATARLPWEDYDKFLQSRKALTSHGPELFGDSVNLYNGALSFSVTDIDLPGNSSLPVALIRSFSVGAYPLGKPMDGAFGDWDIDLPRIEGIYGSTWSSTRCSQPKPGTAIGGSAGFSADEYWQGLQAQMPGGGELLVADTATPKPTNGKTYAFVTAGLTYVRCIDLPATSNATGEGFEALTADGTTYTFEHMAQTHETPLASPSNIGSGSGQLVRKRNAMYVTRIKDRFGHSVDFTYVPGQAATSPVRLHSITASDGRSITLTYASGRIATATAHGRTWSYSYDVPTLQNGSLTGVTLPDTSKWQLGLRSLAVADIQYAADEGARHCTTPPRLLGSEQTASGSVTHPAGAVGNFTVSSKRHGRSNVPRACVNFEFGGNNNASDDFANYPREYLAWTVTEKKITGPALDEMTWTYDYASNRTWACAAGTDDPPYTTPNCPAQIPDGPICADDSCAGSSTTTVSGPGGDWRRYSFGNSFRYDEGLLRKVERGTGADNILHTETHEYRLEQSDQPYALPRGRSLRPRADAFISEQPRPRSRTDIERDGATFSWAGSVFDVYARPTRVVRSSTLGFSRTEDLTYFDSSNLWVLGQLQKTMLGSQVPQETIFDDTTALPTHSYAFGALQSRRTYHSTTAQNGLVHQLFDGGNVNAITLDSYKRGVPQSVALPTGHSMGAVVNDLGEITSVTDATGFSTTYGYDAAGRINSITPPSGDTVNWSPTSIVYAQVNSAEYGLPAGHWRRVETTDARRHETYYDALWRPVLTRQASTDSSMGSRSTRRSFDHEGRETFASYAVDTLNAATTDSYLNLLSGLRTRYDALGRITGTTQNSELGELITRTDYQSPFTTVFTDARNYSTTTTYQAFDVPSYDAPMSIEAPEGVTTFYSRDVYGKPTALGRSGTYTLPSGGSEQVSLTRYYVYDSHQRLCKTREPDAGTTVLDYDAAGNLAWRATGQNALSHATDCQRGSVPVTARSQHHYDALNRLLFINHPVDTDDVGYTYEADGALASATVGVLNAQANGWTTIRNQWTYSYNRRRLLEAETLSLTSPSRSFALDLSYNARGDLSGLVYPSGLSLSFNPNAYGEPRQAGSFATSASYHSSGGVAGFTYQNGATRTVSYNARQLPSRILDQRFSVTQIDHTLQYDAAGNLERLTDGAPAIGVSIGQNESRRLHYDGRNRLTAITESPQGAQSFEYDPLDNLRRSVIAGEDKRYTYSPLSQHLQHIRGPNSRPYVDYAWNGRGELLWREVSAPGNPAVSPPTLFRSGFEGEYIKSKTTFVFDRAGRLVSLDNGGVTHQYDAHGHRVLSEFPTLGARIAVYSRSGQLIHVDDGTTRLLTDYVHLGRRLVAERSRPSTGTVYTVQYLHSDHLGSPSAKSNGSGSLVSRVTHGAWGAPYKARWNDGPGYTGHVMDGIGELVYMQQRYYDPEMQRFISTDPVAADTLNFNRFWYANNNPYAYVDPDGRQACGGQRGCIEAKNFKPQKSDGQTVVQSVDVDIASRASRNLPDFETTGAKENVIRFDETSDGVQISDVESTTTSRGGVIESSFAEPRGASAVGHNHPQDVSDSSPGPGDDAVVNRGYPNTIVRNGNVVVLEKVDGQFRARILNNSDLSSKDRNNIQKDLNIFQKRIQ